MKRAAYIEKLKGFLSEALRGERTLVFWDPAHIHQDVDTGYGWGPKDRPLFTASTSIARSKKVTFFGVYLYNEGKVWLRADKRANSRTVRNTLYELRQRLGDVPNITILCDNASYQKNKLNHRYAKKLGMTIEHIPPYSPDLMPVEELWNWFRQEVARNRIFKTREDLIKAANDFQNRINSNPYKVADRLVVIEQLDPYYEKLLES